ncbi:N-acetylglucosaminyl-phosphatidylinositol de-N-acetylase [Copidosoma floridanum]|uniref:N-acetylglucosaminyl-phosphatidylinositol de-N-acetylase n=1 Tax=Copidosoma floridanum TaxID=29053 RepID=UPI0006C9A73F|nr:N-acetylglucosaminyl-phosphatidylinositol de-N-acetylase [Copidosoma floridanum]XP_014215193.1 N-acetylglucosaminyl-phosphatidylinositol de-N-acetylase [Copidosoma floridanum]XP_014215194.1 N-acetylglucosaminyl-phosphatidylinositol de-N-acetylase [Copidosoma floridanum]
MMSSTDGLFESMGDLVSWCWEYATEISCQVLIALTAYVGVCVFLYYLMKHVDHRAWQLPGPPARLLLVTAHPDDEVMFFGPMIYWLTQSSQVYLLCMSIGGDMQRKEELWACAKRLGIPEANVTIMMCTELPDNPAVQWPEEIVAETVLHHVESCKIDAVVTFDKHGVSKHKNHISLYFAIASLCIEKKVPTYCKLYTLESVNIFRKYTQLLDLPVSLLTASYWYLITYQHRPYIQNAMKAHESQYVWFRKLYMIFSRYTLLNTLHEVNLLDLELDLQLDDDD